MSAAVSNPQTDSLAPLRAAFPGFSDDDLEDLIAYAEETWRQLEAIRADPKRYEHFRALTAPKKSSNG